MQHTYDSSAAFTHFMSPIPILRPAVAWACVWILLWPHQIEAATAFHLHHHGARPARCGPQDIRFIAGQGNYQTGSLSNVWKCELNVMAWLGGVYVNTKGMQQRRKEFVGSSTKAQGMARFLPILVTGVGYRLSMAHLTRDPWSPDSMADVAKHTSETGTYDIWRFFPG